MAEALIHLEVIGSERVERILQTLERNLDTTAILDESAAILLYHIRQRFLQQVDPDGEPWPPSKAAQLRAITGRGGGTLYNTGKLFNSIQLFAPPQENSRSIGTDVGYSVYHQFGTIRLPKREFLGVSQPDVDVAQNLVLKRITEALRP